MLNLNKAQLKVLAEIVYNDIITEAKIYGSNDIDIYKQSKSYQIKSKLYTTIQSEYFENEITINEESIFGLLDIS